MNQSTSQKQSKSARQKRLAEQIFRETRSQISFFAEDTLLKNTSIEKVEVNRDLSLATLYVRFLNDDFNLGLSKNLKNNQNSQEAKEKNQITQTRQQSKQKGLSQQIKEKIQYLNQNSGFFRSNLANKLTIFKVPKIRFIYDDHLEEKERIEALFRKINSTQ